MNIESSNGSSIASIYKGRLLNLMALFMAFPVILIFGLNITVFLFLMIFLRFFKIRNLFGISSMLLLLPLLFAFGAILSGFIGSVNISKSLVVLPNYIYWCLLVIMVVNLKEYINLTEVSKFTAIGVCLSIGYYLFQDSFRILSFILNRLTPNSFSFILICFSPPAFVYLAVVKKSKMLAFIYLTVSVVLLMSEGRRAGTMLVLVPSLLALIFVKIEVKRLAMGFIIFLFSFSFLQTKVAEEAIQLLNPRIYGLLYESENIATEDFSFLVRKLQVEKALLIFEDYPLIGIGLNNFSDFSVNFVGNFEGAERVMSKVDMDSKSAHNSYINILAEGGLFMMVPLLMLLLYNLYQFTINYNKRTQIENAYYWSFMGMCIHLYFITAIVNVYAWFLIGLVSMLTVRYSGGK
jgi:O-antigen ligase